MCVILFVTLIKNGFISTCLYVCFKKKKKMETIIQVINPLLTLQNVLDHVPHVESKLEKNPEESPFLEFEFSYLNNLNTPVLTCGDCKNTNTHTMITDPFSGDTICLGPDGKGCGLVLNSNELIPPYDNRNVTDQDYLFSKQYKFVSFLTGGNSQLQRLNDSVEKHLSQMYKEDQITSDVFKDKQRVAVYALMDKVQEMCMEVDQEWTDEVKKLFHVYRSKMMRIHKRSLVICCLYYIAKYKM